MKIGVWLVEGYVPSVGGGFSYYDKLINAIDNYQFSKEIEICFVTPSKNKISGLNKNVYYLKNKRQRLWCRWKIYIPVIRQLLAESYYREERKYRDKEWIEQLRAWDIQLIYYPIQASCHIQNFPFVINNWDIGHCSTFSFPEVVMNGEFEWRESFYKTILPKALMVFTESYAGKKELVRYLNLKDEKINVLPIFAGGCVDLDVNADIQEQILQKCGLEDNLFFFYPAQFWAHKNHVHLLEAFAEFQKKHMTFKIVFTGSDKYNQKYIEAIAEKLGISSNVLFLGFVDMNVIRTLYAHATSLTMVSYFGPTNMPPLEALHTNCPIICSDLEGHREQLGDAAIYVDPNRSHSIYLAMEEIYASRELYKDRIREQFLITPFKVENTIRLLNDYLLEVVEIRRTWG